MKRINRAWLALLIYCGLTIALTYPLILQLGSVLPHDAGDPALNTWILWWNAHAVPYTSTWWNAPSFYPATGTLAFSEHLLGLSLISTPIQWLGFAPQTAYNVVFLLTFPLCAIGAYLLALELTRREDAAFIAGLLYGFAPYRIAQLAHIQVLAAYGMPLALLALHRYIREPRVRWLALFGASWFMQAISNGHYLLFFALIIAVWILWFAPPWKRRNQCVAIVSVWLISSLPLLPLLWQYRVIHQRFHFARDFGAMTFFGADAMALLNSGRWLSFWGGLRVFRRPEGELFPGLTIVIIILAGVMMLRRPPITVSRSRLWSWPRAILFLIAGIAAAIAISIYLIGPWELKSHGYVLVSVANPFKPLTYVLAVGILLVLTSARLRTAYAARSVLGFYAVVAFVTWLLSLGPSPSFMGGPFMYRGPYALLTFLPGYNALRVPARFWMITVLCFSAIGAMIFARLTERLGRGRFALMVLVALGVLVDGWVSEFPLVRPPAMWTAESCASGDISTSRAALLELPVGLVLDDVAAMYRSISHGHPVVNGYSGYSPPHYAALRYGLLLHEDDMLTTLAAHGVSHFVVNADKDRDGSWGRYVAGHHGAELVCTEGRQSLYRLHETAAAKIEVRGAPLPVAEIEPNAKPNLVGKMVDGDMATRWESGPQSEGTWVIIDLGADRSINAVELMLGRFYEDFARTLTIEASDDRKSWREVWRGGSAQLAFTGAINSPGEVPLRYELPPTRARYLRLRLLSNDETYYWSIAELKVYGS